LIRRVRSIYTKQQYAKLSTIDKIAEDGLMHTLNGLTPQALDQWRSFGGNR